MIRLPARTEFGSGAFIRSLVLSTPAPGRLSLGMEDPVHAFQIDFSHRAGLITEVHAHWERRPMSSCAGAPDALAAMVGCRLSDSVFDVARHTDANQQCTHLHDMFCIGATHAQQRRPDCRWDVIVPDAVEGSSTATLYRNGEPVLEFEVAADMLTLLAPEACRGISVLKGFLAWVRANVSPELHEQYFLMQKALFLLQVQRLDLESRVGKLAALSGPPAGICFGSQPQRYATAIRVGELRRFRQDSAGELLHFFRPGGAKPGSP